MQIQSERSKEIDAYISSHPDSKVGDWPIEISGEKRILPFFRFPIKLLRYNVNNGRFSMERLEWEHNHHSSLDASQPDGVEKIREFLLELDKEKANALEEDLRKKGQMEPGVITHDGFVINGNRRMAVIERLHSDEPTGKWEFIEAVRLPKEISEKDQWKIEAGLQLSMDKVAEYHPVNELLKIKQGINAGLSPDEIAAALYGRDVDYIKQSLKRLEIIDTFLEFLGQPRNYGFIKKFGLHESFIDLQKTVVDQKGLSSKQKQEQLSNAFALIRAGVFSKPKRNGRKQKSITHWDIRKLGKIFSEPFAKDAFLKNLAKSRDLRDVDCDVVIDDFRNAIDELENIERRDQPIKLVEKAISALQRIDRKSKHFREDRVKEAILRLSELVKAIQTELE